jgi:hypothetical protein
MSEIEWSDFREASRALKQERHAGWKAENMEFLKTKSGLWWIEKGGGETLLFREEGMPKVDFYPSTGRWRVAGVQKTFSGGAQAFVAWYRDQKGKE